MVGGRRHLRRSGSRGVGRDGAGDAVRPTAVLYRVPEAGRVVRWLGRGLPIVAHQGVAPVFVEICSAGIAGLSRLCGLGSQFNGAFGGMLGLVGCQRHPQCRELLVGLEPTEALGGLQHGGTGPAQRHGRLLDEPWVLDVDTTIKPLYGEQEGAELGYNPHKPGRPSHCYHTYMLSNLRLVLSVDVQPGDQHNVKHATGGLWSLLDRWDRGRWPRLLRGDLAWGIEPVMAQAEQRNLAYLFRLRTTKNVSRALQRAMAQSDWSDAGHGWQGKETCLRLEGWSRQRRVILLRRQLKRPLAIVDHGDVDHGDPAQPRLGFAEVGPDRQVWEYAALVTSLDSEILTLGQLYRDRADCENTFDELKNQWGWGGFTTLAPLRPTACRKLTLLAPVTRRMSA